MMGILNLTPDSFSDGGLFVDEAAARAHIDSMVSAGADIIDIGAESTRPGAPSVPAAEQVKRVGQCVRYAAKSGALVSIDTTSREVAAFALSEGATIINSVSLEPAAELGALAAQHNAALVLMHCRGAMSDMPGFSSYADDAYQDVVHEVASEWTAAAEKAQNAGLPAQDLVLDPGLGFAKNARQSLTLCARLAELVALGYPVLVGTSRKSFLAHAARASSDAPLAAPSERLGASIASVLACAARGASIARVHDVLEVRQALAFMTALDASSAAEAHV